MVGYSIAVRSRTLAPESAEARTRLVKNLLGMTPKLSFCPEGQRQQGFLFDFVSFGGSGGRAGAGRALH